MKLDWHAKYIPISAALKIVDDEAKKAGYQTKRRREIRAYVSALPVDGENCVRLDQISGVLNNLKQACLLKDPAYLAKKRGFWVDRVPDAIEIAESKEFANQRGSIWKSTKDNLWQIFHETSTSTQLPYTRPTTNGNPPCIIILSGAGGTGKSETTWLTFFVGLTWMLMLNDPHAEFNHNPGRWIQFVFQGIKEKTSRETLFDSLQYAIDNSPWYQKYARRRPDYNEELQWPSKRIKVVNLTGMFNAALSKDVFFGAITEINEMPVYKKSSKTKDDKPIFDVGAHMWDYLANRTENRFSQADGDFPGKLIADSARSHDGDFVDQMKTRMKTDSRVLMVERTLWEAKSHEYPESEPKFLVELGDDHRGPRIIEARERAIDPDRVVEVPARHKQRFLDDPEKACKDFIGEPMRSTGRFIPFPEKITIAQEKYVELMGDLRPFKFETISFRELFGEIATGQAIDWSLLINYEYFDAILDKDTPFTMHADLSLSQDATGFAFGRVIGSKMVSQAHFYNQDLNLVQELESIEAPIYQIDGILQVVARPGEIIDVNMVEALGLHLKRYINMRFGSADWLEAWSMLLNWRRAGIVADKYSVDTRPNGYFEYKHALRDERLIMQPHSVNDKETRKLKRSAAHTKVKIDHPDGGSKDLADSVSGCLGVLAATEGQKYYRVIEAEHAVGAFDGFSIETDALPEVENHYRGGMMEQFR